jgi:hypothetical protein
MSKSADSVSHKKYFFVVIVELVSCQLVSFYRRVIRFILHLITGRSELERICLNEKVESTRIKKIGNFCWCIAKNVSLKVTKNLL